MLFEDIYHTIEHAVEGIYKDKGSKFLSFAYPITQENRVKDILLDLRKEHVGARHFCYAYVLGPDQSCFRANDDGEPSYTAGKPILGQIKSNDLTNILIVVVRYFGGTLLGVSGLINAYKNAAADALDKAIIIQKTINEHYQINFEYELLNEVMPILKAEKVTIIHQQFDLSCSIIFYVRKNQALQTEGNLKNIKNLQIKYLKTE